MPTAILILDIFDSADFYEFNFDLVYDPLKAGAADIKKHKHKQAVTIQGLAIDLFDNILMAGLSDFILVGCGVGGMVALQLALLLRGRDDVQLKGLCLIGSSPVSPSRGLLPQAMGLKSPMDYLNSLCAPSFPKSDALLASFRAKFELYGGSSGGILEEISDAIQEFALVEEELVLLTPIPLLLIHGEKDRMVDPSYSLLLKDYWNSKNAHCQVQIIAGAGHWTHVEIPNLTSSLISNFVHGPHPSALKMPEL